MDAGWQLHSSAANGTLPGAATEYNDIDNGSKKDPLIVAPNSIQCCYYASSKHVAYVYHVDSQTQWEIAQFNVPLHNGYTMETITRDTPTSTVLHGDPHISGTYGLTGFVYPPVNSHPVTGNPTGSIDSPSQDGTLVRRAITVSGTAVDTVSPVSSITLAFDGAAFATVSPPTANWSVPFDPTGRPRGVHTITLTVSDQQGVSRSYARTVRLPMGTAGDYFGTGKACFSVFRPSTGYWFTYQPVAVLQNAFGSFGGQGDVPVPGDYDGDGRADCAFYVPWDGSFYAYCSPAIQLHNVLGQPGDAPSTYMLYPEGL